MNSDKYYIAYAGDDNFAMQMGLSIYSLLEKNQNINMCIYVFSENISYENKTKIESIAKQYSTELIICEMPDLNQMAGFELTTARKNFFLAKSTYCRLFLTELLPNDVDKVLWIDGDTIIADSISCLLSTDISEYGGAAILDANNNCKLLNGFKKKSEYFNAGIFLLNLKYWRENGIYGNIIHEITRRQGKGIDHDQSILNCVLKGNIKKISPQFNMTHMYCTANNNYEDYLKMSGYCPAEIYTKEELNYANENPVIFHFTNCFDSRPWLEGCTHPGAVIWEEYLKKSPWQNYQKKPAPNYSKDKILKKSLKWIKNHIVLKIDLLRIIYIKIMYGFWQ